MHYRSRERFYCHQEGSSTKHLVENVGLMPPGCVGLMWASVRNLRCRPLYCRDHEHDPPVAYSVFIKIELSKMVFVPFFKVITLLQRMAKPDRIFLEGCSWNWYKRKTTNSVHSQSLTNIRTLFHNFVLQPATPLETASKEENQGSCRPSLVRPCADTAHGCLMSFCMRKHEKCSPFANVATTFSAQ